MTDLKTNVREYRNAKCFKTYIQSGNIVLNSTDMKCAEFWEKKKKSVLITKKLWFEVPDSIELAKFYQICNQSPFSEYKIQKERTRILVVKN